MILFSACSGTKFGTFGDFREFGVLSVLVVCAFAKNLGLSCNELDTCLELLGLGLSLRWVGFGFGWLVLFLCLLVLEIVHFE